MSSEHSEVYILQEADDEWVSPTPASTAVREAVAGETELDPDDIDDIEEYTDVDALQSLLEDDDGELTFAVEGHDVTVGSDGTITVQS